MATTPATNYGMLLTTVAKREDGASIAKMLLERRLAACVQLLPIESYYTWKGDMANEAELLLLVKTKTSHFEEAISAIRSAHPYETPEILTVPFSGGYTGYFEWIDEVTK